MNTTLTAVPGFRVGHWTDPIGQTGCTVILPPPEGAVASASFLGPSPATREGVLLSPEKKVERVHGLLLTGGSAFGLSAAGGVVRWLEEQGVGHPTHFARVPIVPAAVIYDLGAGDPKARPGEAQGYLAAQGASSGPVKRGRVGAGTGASIGKYLGPARAVAGGLGSVFLRGTGSAWACWRWSTQLATCTVPAATCWLGQGWGRARRRLHPTTWRTPLWSLS